MSDALFILAVLFVAIVAPVWIITRALSQGRRRRDHALGREQTLTELGETAQRMEQRIESLEKILDAQAPQWRERL